MVRLVTIEDADHQILLKAANPVQFPLSENTQHLVDKMERFIIDLDQERGVAGMAAPQLGQDLCIIFIQVQKEWSKYRANVFDDIPLMPLFNPRYEPVIEDGMDKDFEGCFSVPNLAIEVYRYKTINYSWQDSNGQKQQGVAKGFLARLLQHEIDHLNGILHNSLMREDCRSITFDELMALRQQMIEEAEAESS